MNKLPSDAELVIDESKLTQYLLNENHPVGQSKARYFLQKGFSVAQPECLQTALIEHGKNRELVKTTSSHHGTKYEVSCLLSCPDGKERCITSVWLKEGANLLRLITAYPR